MQPETKTTTSMDQRTKALDVPDLLAEPLYWEVDMVIRTMLLMGSQWSQIISMR